MGTKCCNRNCDSDPFQSIGAICVTIDGDFVCSKECETEYKKQTKKFFDALSDNNFDLGRWLNE